MIDYEKQKPFMNFNPIEFCEEYNLIFNVNDLGLEISYKNWPSNLIYNPALLYSDDMFHEQFCSDSTLYFYIESARGRCISLISRATHNQGSKWEHGDINIYDIPEACEKSWMIRTRTNLALRKII